MASAAGSSRLFVGRTDAMGALNHRFADLRAGKGGVTLLLGETGVGKSTLVDALVNDIRAHEVRVLIGRALAVDDPPRSTSSSRRSIVWPTTRP
ncbi:MAG: ATP-binding protein [Thermoplasmata archaeon]